jgi:hypothetical protein
MLPRNLKKTAETAAAPASSPTCWRIRGAAAPSGGGSTSTHSARALNLAYHGSPHAGSELQYHAVARPRPQHGPHSADAAGSYPGRRPGDQRLQPCRTQRPCDRSDIRRSLAEKSAGAPPSTSLFAIAVGLIGLSATRLSRIWCAVLGAVTAKRRSIARCRRESLYLAPGNTLSGQALSGKWAQIISITVNDCSIPLCSTFFGFSSIPY